MKLRAKLNLGTLASPPKMTKYQKKLPRSLISKNYDKVTGSLPELFAKGEEDTRFHLVDHMYSDFLILQYVSKDAAIMVKQVPQKGENDNISLSTNYTYCTSFLFRLRSTKQSIPLATSKEYFLPGLFSFAFW